MKSHHSGWVLAVGVALLTFTHPVSATEKETMPKRVIVQVKGTETKGIEGDVISPKTNQRQTLLQVDVPDGRSTSSFIKELKSEPNVIRAEEDRLLQLAYTPGDPFYYGQYHHQTIRTSEAWDRSMGSNVTVAILDNGIDMNHEDLMGKIVDPYDVTYDSPYTLTMGDHGTHVAGIVGSAIENGYGGVGVAPAASIMPIDVFAGSSAYTSEVIEGIYRAVDHGANIINMSLGNYSYSSFFQDAINYAYDHNVVVVAAAGNDATNLTHYPSSYDHVISVGSTTQEDTRSYFSNYGPYVDITAPGTDVLSTTPYNFYETYSGTSMASPVVAGVAALVKSYEPGLSVDDITYRLTNTADDLGSAGRDDYYGSGRINAKAALKIRDVAPPVINEFSDASNAVTGTVPSGNGYGRVIIYDEWGYTVAWKDYLVGGDYFTISTPPYKAGTNLKAAFYDYRGDMSPYTEFTVLDKTPPAEPAVIEMSDKGEYLIGYTDPNSYVEVRSSMSGFLTSGYADSIGQFVFYIGKQTAGSDLFINSIDTAGNMSPTATIHISDMTPPVITSLNDVTDQSTEVSGYTEPYVHISVFDSKEKMVGEGESDPNGYFSVPIERLTSNQLVYFIATDQAGNVAEKMSTTVLDRTAPEISSVEEVGDDSTEVKGRAEIGSTIELKDAASTLLAQAKTNESGDFVIPISQQKKGTMMYLTAVDDSSNTSEPISIEVRDRTKPFLEDVSEVSDRSVQVTGRTEPDSFVKLMNDAKQVIAQGDADQSGNFTLVIDKQKAGTTLNLSATDEEGNTSEVMKIKVLDRTAPVITKVNEVSDQSTAIFGTTEASATLIVKKNGNELVRGKADDKGTFNLVISKQAAKEKLTITAVDAANNSSDEKVMTVVDKTAPTAPQVNEVSDRATTISGKAEAKSTVIVTIGNVEKWRTTARVDGTFSLTIERMNAGTELEVVAVDEAKNSSTVTKVTVKDRTAPAQPKVNEVSDRSTTVTGTTEKNAKVILQKNKEELVRTTADGTGQFTLTIPKQAVGTELVIIAQDDAGNASTPFSIFVIDKTAPVQPTVETVTDLLDTVKGKAEVDSTVTVKAGSTVLGEVTVKEDGLYAIVIGKQKAGTVLTVTSTDKAGNVSQAVEMKVLDRTAPAIPVVTEVTDQSTSIKGTAEVDSTITVKVGTSELTKGVVGKDGTFNLAIAKQKAGTVLTLVSTDGAGNASKSIEVKVLDRTAPIAPTLSEVTDQTVTISGNAEVDAVISIKVGNTEIGKATVDKSGMFQVTIPKQTAGTTLTATATDVAGNISPIVTSLVADKTAPSLQVSQITNQSVRITGTTEAKAKVQMVYATKVVETTADTNGEFSFTITAPKTNEEFGFTATDVQGNKSDVLKVKVTDVTLPVLKGTTDVTIEAGTVFDAMNNVTAMDETDGNLTKSIVVSGKVDTQKPGMYSLTYRVTDRTGNEIKVTRNVTVKDTIKPLILGVKNQSINLNASFNPKSGVTAKDNIDGMITQNIRISGSVNVKKVGVYTLTYKISDNSGNTTTVIRKITVKDNIKPTISGAKSKTIKYKSSFNPKAGVSAKDNVDGTLTKSIKVTGSVNTKRKGVYPLSYSVKDKAGNSTSVKIKITVK